MRSAAAAILAITVGAALTGLGGDPLACVSTGVCDGAGISAGPIAQPFAAWSALALGVVGIAVMDDRDATVGLGLLVSSIGALWYHASLTTWAGVVDAAGVAAIAVGLGLREWVPARHLRRVGPAAAAIVIGLAAAGAAGLATVAGGAVAAAGLAIRYPGRAPGPLWGSVGLFGLGLVFWVRGPHGIWHVAAAGAIGLLVVHMRSSRTLDPPLRSAYQGDTT